MNGKLLCAGGVSSLPCMCGPSTHRQRPPRPCLSPAAQLTSNVPLVVAWRAYVLLLLLLDDELAGWLAGAEHTFFFFAYTADQPYLRSRVVVVRPLGFVALVFVCCECAGRGRKRGRWGAESEGGARVDYIVRHVCWESRLKVKAGGEFWLWIQVLPSFCCALPPRDRGVDKRSACCLCVV